MTTATNIRFADLVRKVQVRHEDLNPIDRESKLGRFRFILANPDEVNNENFNPRWGITSPGVSGFPGVAELSPHAIGQFCSRSMLDYNPRLLGRLRPDYVFEDLNYLLQHDVADKGSFVRMIHPSEDNSTAIARAILGSRFTPLDDLELLTVCDEFLRDGIVRFHGFTGLTSHFTVTFPSEVRPDGIEPGVHIANSECGVRSVTIQSVLFRRVCTNVLPRIDMQGDFGQFRGGNLYIRDGDGDHNITGARRGIVEGGWRFIHVGNHDKLRGFVKQAVEEATDTDNPLLEMWDKGLEQRIDDPIKAIERVARMSRLSKEERDVAATGFAFEAEASGMDFAATVTGVANAFTRAANWQEDIEKRYQFQVAGANAFQILN